MPVFRIEGEQGHWLTDMALNVDNWKAGDAIYHGRSKIEGRAVRESAEKTPLVVKGHALKNDWRRRRHAAG